MKRTQKNGPGQYTLPALLAHFPCKAATWVACHGGERGPCTINGPPPPPGVCMRASMQSTPHTELTCSLPHSIPACRGPQALAATKSSPLILTSSDRHSRVHVEAVEVKGVGGGAAQLLVLGHAHQRVRLVKEGVLERDDDALQRTRAMAYMMGRPLLFRLWFRRCGVCAAIPAHPASKSEPQTCMAPARRSTQSTPNTPPPSHTTHTHTWKAPGVSSRVILRMKLATRTTLVASRAASISSSTKKGEG